MKLFKHTLIHLFLLFHVQHLVQYHHQLLIYQISKYKKRYLIYLRLHKGYYTLVSCFISRVNASHSTSILSTYSTFLIRASTCGSSKNPSGIADESSDGVTVFVVGNADFVIDLLVSICDFDEPESKKSEKNIFKSIKKYIF